MQGFKMVARELQAVMRELTLYGYGLILITHEKSKNSEFVDDHGAPILAVEPDLGSKNTAAVINAVVDLIAYAGLEKDEDGQLKRWLYTRQTPTIVAGSRWQFLDEKIPFSYDSLVDAIDRAIEKQRERGDEVVDYVEPTIVQSRPFNEVMNEAKTLWISYLEQAVNEEEKEHHLAVMKDIIRDIFGNENFKLSNATPSQKDLVELFITQLKDETLTEE